MTASKVWIQTFTGQRFDLVNPAAGAVRLRDIAEALAKANRYTGHTKRPYSVAQHSVFCSLHVSARARRYALLHDAEEAYTGDVSTPMKMALKAMGAGEAMQHVAHGVRKAIFERFHLEFPPPEDIWAEVKKADLLALATEKRDLLCHALPWDWTMPEPCAEKIEALPWWDAAQVFYDRARVLGCGE